LSNFSLIEKERRIPKPFHATFVDAGTKKEAEDFERWKKGERVITIPIQDCYGIIEKQNNQYSKTRNGK